VSLKRRERAERRDAAERAERLKGVLARVKGDAGEIALARASAAQARDDQPEAPAASPTVIVWHPVLGYCDRWKAIAYDKSLLNDAPYPTRAPPGVEPRRQAFNAHLRQERDAVREAQAQEEEEHRADEEEAEEAEREAEERFLAQVLSVIGQLGRRLAALEDKKRERHQLDDETAEAEEAMVRNDPPAPTEPQPLPN
jgi:hypothetical protein